MQSAYEESFWKMIGLTGRAMRSFADKRLRRYSLTVEQLQVLKHIDGTTGQPQSKLSSLTGKSPANMTRILDRLEKKKRIIRRQNPLDRRSSLVFLTKHGDEVREDVRRLFEGLQAELVEGIPVEEQKVAIEVLRSIKKNIDTMAKKTVV